MARDRLADCAGQGLEGRAADLSGGQPRHRAARATHSRRRIGASSPGHEGLMIVTPNVLCNTDRGAHIPAVDRVPVYQLPPRALVRTAGLRVESVVTLRG